MAVSALRKRIAPSVALALNLETDSGGKMSRTFRLCLDFNAISEIEERTVSPRNPQGISLLRGDIWGKLSASTLRVMLWASVLAHHPEFDTYDEEGKRTDDGLEVIGSYMDAGNTEAIAEALWHAYLASNSEEKRKILEQARLKIENETPKAGGDAIPLVPAPAPSETLAGIENGSSSMPSQDSISDSPKANSAS
jgi:hypothetical protein